MGFQEQRNATGIRRFWPVFGFLMLVAIAIISWFLAPAVIEMTAVGRMRDLTALPQVVATLMVGRREVSLPGVIAPEAPGGPDPDRFLAALEEMGLTIETRVS